MTTSAPSGEPAPQPTAPAAAAPTSSIRAFEQGDVLFRQGDEGNVAFLLEEGSIRLVKRVRGEGRSLSVLRSGDLFGENALVPEPLRSSTAIALTSGLARTIQPATLPDLIARDPEAAADVLRQLVRRLQEAEDQIEIMMLSDTQSKVVAALLKLAQKASTDGASASFEMSPMELSTRVGLDVDTVKRTVQQLREGQYLRVTEGRLEVPDLESLQRFYALLGVKDDLRGES